MKGGLIFLSRDLKHNRHQVGINYGDDDNDDADDDDEDNDHDVFSQKHFFCRMIILKALLEW